MIGFLTFCTAIIWIIIVAKRKNDNIKKKRRKIKEVDSRESRRPKGKNRALSRIENAENKSAPEEKLPAKEAVEEGHIDISFDENALMDEVYDIMVCGYPAKSLDQRDFITEGQELLDRYMLSQ